MAMGERSILLEKRDGIGCITFNRPEKLNAIRPQDYILLDDLVNDCEKDDNIRVVILTGKGKAFSVGDDFEGWPGGKKDHLIKEDPLYGVFCK